MDQQHFEKRLEECDDRIIELERKLKTMKALLVLLPVLFIFGTYAVGYFTTSQLAMARNGMVRIFATRWQADIYKPAAVIESAFSTSQTVSTESYEP